MAGDDEEVRPAADTDWTGHEPLRGTGGAIPFLMALAPGLPQRDPTLPESDSCVPEGEDRFLLERDALRDRRNTDSPLPPWVTGFAMRGDCRNSIAWWCRVRAYLYMYRRMNVRVEFGDLRWTAASQARSHAPVLGRSHYAPSLLHAEKRLQCIIVRSN